MKELSKILRSCCRWLMDLMFGGKPVELLLNQLKSSWIR